MSGMVDRNSEMMDRKASHHLSEILKGDESHNDLGVGEKEWWRNEIGNVFAVLDLQRQSRIQPSPEQSSKWSELSKKYRKVLQENDLYDQKINTTSNSKTYGSTLELLNEFFGIE